MEADRSSQAAEVLTFKAETGHGATATVLDGRPPEVEPELHRDYVVMLRAGLDMLNARLLLLLALIFAAGMWFWCAYDPVLWRFNAASAFSLSVLWPIVVLYARKG